MKSDVSDCLSFKLFISKKGNFKFVQNYVFKIIRKYFVKDRHCVTMKIFYFYFLLKHYLHFENYLDARNFVTRIALLHKMHLNLF